MDKIHVTTDSLNTAGGILNDFSEQFSITAARFESDLKKMLAGVDDEYKNELTEYIRRLNTLKVSIALFASENIHALKERMEKLTDYSNAKYKRRNI